MGGGTAARFKKLEILKLEILNLDKIYKHSAACYVHKRKRKFSVQQRPRVELRMGDVAAWVPRWRKTHSRLQGAYSAPLFYNGLPAPLRETVGMKCFSRDLKE